MHDVLIASLRMLVSFRTVEGNRAAKEECLDWIAEEFLAHAQCPIERGVVHGCPYLLMACEQPQLTWFGHIDVVPGFDEQFSLVVRGDRLYGRGAKDMKGAMVPFLLMFRSACERGTPPPVHVLLTSDEEVGGITIPTLLACNKARAPAAFTPDTGSNPWIVVEHKAVVSAQLTARGRGGHAAIPWQSCNPVPLLARAILTLEDACPHGADQDWQMTATPTMLSAASTRNVIPDEASCIVDIRLTPEQARNPESAIDSLRAALPDYCTLELLTATSSLHTPADHPMVLRVQRIAEEVLGHDVPIGREHGGTDARHFGAAGIPAFLYGPEGAGLHGSDEWVSLPSLRQHVEINKRLLALLAG